MTTLDVQNARSQFPSLASGFIFGDNAGGSQTAKVVVDRISDYLLNTNAQLGADYAVSAESTRRVTVLGPQEAAKLFNADPEEIVFAASSTMNIDNLSRGLENDIKSSDEFIVMGEHEANVGPWKRLAARKGITVKFWKPKPTNPENPYSLGYKTEDLLSLVTGNTRIVAMSACSNILGTIIPVKEVVAALRTDAKAKGAPKVEISVDCVAYAPHRFVNVKEWDVDFATFSFYKVYGPHISAMYTRASCLTSSINALTHHFLKVDDKAYKLQPGGPGYELVYGTTGSLEYLLSLTASRTLDASFQAIAAHEQVLVKNLLDFLTAPAQWERGVRIVGDGSTNLSRVPTISFVVVGQRPIRSPDIVAFADKKGDIGIRFGHFYAYTLVDELSPKINPDDGVVRVSLVHYNTAEEVERIIKVLKEAFDTL